MAAISETLFKGVRVKRLDDEGNSIMVYTMPVVVQLEYDPKVINALTTFKTSESYFRECL